MGKLQRGAYSSERYYINPVSFKPDIRHFKSSDYMGQDGIKNLGDELLLLDPIADFEIYQVKTKLIYILILELMLTGMAKSLALANKYSEKTGIKVNIKEFRKQSRKKLPTVKSIVQNAKKQGKNPDVGTIAVAYRW